MIHADASFILILYFAIKEIDSNESMMSLNMRRRNVIELLGGYGRVGR